MIPVTPKAVVILDPTSTTAAATSTGLLDTLGFDYASIDVHASASDSTSNNATVLKLAECDTSNGTFSDITALVGDGTDGFIIAAAKTSASLIAKFNVDLRARKRYLKMSISPATTQTLTAIANLFKGEDAPSTTAKSGADVLVQA